VDTLVRKGVIDVFDGMTFGGLQGYVDDKQTLAAMDHLYFTLRGLFRRPAVRPATQAEGG
jgi:hypothetical protein